MLDSLHIRPSGYIIPAIAFFTLPAWQASPTQASKGNEDGVKKGKPCTLVLFDFFTEYHVNSLEHFGIQLLCRYVHLCGRYKVF